MLAGGTWPSHSAQASRHRSRLAVAFGLLALLIVRLALAASCIDAAVLFRGTAPCAAAAGLAAFCMVHPVFADARLVSVDNACERGS